MSAFPRSARLAARPLLAGSLGLAVAVTGISVLATPAQAISAGLVISEVYGAGGNAGASLNQDFVELYNPTTTAISLAGKSLQYRSSTGTANPTGVAALSGTVQPGDYYVVGLASGSNGSALPTPDETNTGVNLSGTAGTVFLANQAGALTAPATGSVTNNAAIIDLVGYGTSNTFETTLAPAPSGTASISRATADSDVNATDFVATTPPTPGAAYTAPAVPNDFTGTIAQIQGTNTATSPHAGDNATTTGVVTAAYPTGGINGFYLQTGGTGGATDATPGASDAIFVYGGPSGFTTYPAIGASVQVEGLVSEFSGTTEITSTSADVTPLATALAPVTALAAAYPTTEAAREAHEGELLAPTDRFTVTNTFSTNQYAEIGLATGTKPLIQPTDVARVGTAALDAVKADNAARGVVLDDAATTNFLSGTARDTALPWLSKANPIRVGAAATLKAPVILEYRNSVWKLQPRGQVTGDGASVATFTNTRTTAPEKVGGDLELATFNVLNYFNTTGVDFVAGGAGRACTYFTDRQGNNVTDNNCTPNGPRGAAEADDLKRQQDKIVAAINALGADVVSLEEIENSVAIGETDRDDALRTLVGALNAATGSTRWAFAPSPPASELPPGASQDVIRTAFIYDPATVKLVGASDVLADSPAFANAREPLAQAFKRKGSSDKRAFAVVVNHFKSKGDSSPVATGDNANGEQGAFNGDRVRQATALNAFAKSFAKSRKTRKIFLTGDFNSYTQEDPMHALYGAGFTNIGSSTPGESTYSFSGLSGSLDHVLANKQALRMVTGSDVWNINSPESVAFEYSRFNYNLTSFYEPNMFRASDHDPEVVGLRTEKIKPTVKVTKKPRTAVAGRTRVRLVVTVKAAGDKAGGFVKVRVPGQKAVLVKLKKGKATITLPRFAKPGKKVVKVTYNGRGEIKRTTTKVTVKVVRR